MKKVLGIGGELHDTSISVASESIEMALQEERVSRTKKDGGFPVGALRHKDRKDVDHDVSILAVPEPDESAAMFDNTSVKQPLGDAIKRRNGFCKETPGEDVVRIGHHRSHASAAYFASNFDDAVVITMDGGSLYEPWCTTISEGKGQDLITLKEDTRCFTDSYFFATALAGFTPNRHEGKLTGLSAQGSVDEKLLGFFKRINERKKNIAYDISKWEGIESPGNDPRILLNKDKIRKYRRVISNVSKEEIASTVQHFTERQVINYIDREIEDIDNKNVVLSGGLFANVALNRKVKDMGFRNIFICPAMGDEGLSLGSTFEYLSRSDCLEYPHLENVFLGPQFSNVAVKSTLEKWNVKYRYIENINLKVAELLSEGEVVSRFNGRMEFGPRALGNRSILYQTTDPSANDWLNRELKRTEFMPFAPATLIEDATMCYQNLEGTRHAAEFMTITFDCTNYMKEQSPGAVHSDGTARAQLVTKENNPELHQILNMYKNLTGIPSLINTSFNNHGEPMVCTPKDALRSFNNNNLKYLAIENFLVEDYS